MVEKTIGVAAENIQVPNNGQVRDKNGRYIKTIQHQTG